MIPKPKTCSLDHVLAYFISLQQSSSCADPADWQFPSDGIHQSDLSKQSINHPTSCRTELRFNLIEGLEDSLLSAKFSDVLLAPGNHPSHRYIKFWHRCTYFDLCCGCVSAKQNRFRFLFFLKTCLRVSLTVFWEIIFFLHKMIRINIEDPDPPTLRFSRKLSSES